MADKKIKVTLHLDGSVSIERLKQVRQQLPALEHRVL